jgi:hypothetical protein
VPSPFKAPCHKVIEHEDSEIRIWLPRPTLLLTRMRGYLRHEYALEIIRCLDVMPPSKPIVQFHDWLEMTGFDVRCQRDLTAWHVTHRQQVARLDIAVQSALVRMGVAVANVPLKGAIRIYDNVRSFESEVERTVHPPR